MGLLSGCLTGQLSQSVDRRILRSRGYVWGAADWANVPNVVLVYIMEFFDAATAFFPEL